MYISREEFVLTPRLERMLAAIDKVDCGRYAIRFQETEAIIRHCNENMLLVALKAFNLGFSRGMQRIKRIPAKNPQEQKENALRELLDRFASLPDERKEIVLAAMEAAMKMGG